MSSDNGTSNGKRAGIGDLFVTGEGGGGFDPVRELLTGSSEAAEFLPRTRLTEKEIARDMRILGRRQRYRKGSTNVDDLIWYRLQAVISLDSRGRQEAVQMVVGLAASRNPTWGMPSGADRFRSQDQVQNDKRREVPRG